MKAQTPVASGNALPLPLTLFFHPSVKSAPFSSIAGASSFSPPPMLKTASPHIPASGSAASIALNRFIRPPPP